MSKADAVSTTFELHECSRDSLRYPIFDGMRIMTLPFRGALYLETWSVVDALDRADEEVEGTLALVRDDEALSVDLVDSAGRSEERGFMTISAACRIARSCSDVDTPGSASGRFLQWLAGRVVRVAPPRSVRRTGPPAVGRRYGSLIALDGGRA